MKPKTRKFIAALQIIGGITLILSCVSDIYRIPETHNILSIAMYLAFMSYAGAAILFGGHLWKDYSSATIPCVLIWATQIPWVISKPLSFGVVTGFGLVFQIVSTPMGMSLGFDFPLIERHVLYVAGQSSALVMGINFFAVFCVQYLWSRRAINTPID